MESVRTSETSVYSNETTWRNIPECSPLHTPRRENLKSLHSLFPTVTPSVLVDIFVVSHSHAVSSGRYICGVPPSHRLFWPMYLWCPTLTPSVTADIFVVSHSHAVSSGRYICGVPHSHRLFLPIYLWFAQSHRLFWPIYLWFPTFTPSVLADIFVVSNTQTLSSGRYVCGFPQSHRLFWTICLWFPALAPSVLADIFVVSHSHTDCAGAHV
jgi:hypothetical protein